MLEQYPANSEMVRGRQLFVSVVTVMFAVEVVEVVVGGGFVAVDFLVVEVVEDVVVSSVFVSGVVVVGGF